MRRQHAAEQALYAEMRTFFTAQAKYVAEEFARAGPGGKPEAYLRSEWDEALIATARGVVEAILLTGALAELEESGKQYAGLTKALPSADAARASLPRVVLDRVTGWLDSTFKLPFWGGINDTVRGDLAEALKAALDAGENLHQTAARIEKALGEGAKERAYAIARTETTGALGAGRQASLEHLADIGAVTGKTWYCILDSSTRESHRAAHDQTVGVRDDFVVGGFKAAHPGDQRLPPAERCGCRCVVVSVTAE